MTLENGTAEAPVATTPKGKVVILNGASASTRAAILGSLESQLVDHKTRVVDSYIMTKPSSYNLMEQELRSVYIQEVLNSADQGHTILLTTYMLNGSGGQRDVENILSIFRGKQVPLFWVNADFEPRDSKHCSSSEAGYTQLGPRRSRAVRPSRTRHNLKNIELVTRTFTAENSTGEAVQELLEVMGSTR